jgi:AraC-like DNA-binding protein
MDFRQYFNTLIILIPMIITGCCITLSGFSRRNCLTRQERTLKNVVILYLFATFLEWLALFCYVFFPEAFVFLNSLYLACFVLAVFFYRIIRFLTRLEQIERFSPWHYFVPALIGTAFLVWSLSVPFDAQVEMVRSRMPVREHEVYSRLFMSKPLLRAAFMLIYYGLIARLLIRYYRRASDADSTVRKPVHWIVFLLILSLAFMLPSILTILLPQNRIYSSAWTAVTAFGMSGQYIVLTFHIIRRKYLSYAVYAEAEAEAEAEEESKKGSEGRRLHAGKLTHRRLNVWFRTQKPYLKGDFKITDAADAMDVNRSVISAFINRNYGMNFNRFVNRWRLEELERLRSLPSNKGKSIAQLFAKAGFTEARQYYRAVAAEREKSSEP